MNQMTEEMGEKKHDSDVTAVMMAGGSSVALLSYVLC